MIKRFLAFSAAAILSAGAAIADDAGKGYFMQYCSTCHGTDGAGQGPLIEMMNVPAPDLSMLSKNNDGKFPMLQVIHVIDGRTGLRAHGGPMPVYGAIFSEEADRPGPYGATLHTRGKILSIAYYLESLQQ